MHANFVALDKFQTAVEMEEFKVQALMHAVRFVFNYFSNFEPLYITYWHNECLPGL